MWREAFEAPEGYTFVIADYGSQELKIAADKSQDPAMLEELRNNGDLHRLAASGLYNKPLNEVTDAERKEGKTFNFSIIYGAGASKTAAQFKSSLKEAQKRIDGYYIKFPKLKEYQDKVFQQSLRNGYITLDKLGSRCNIPNYREFKFLEKEIDVQYPNREWVKKYRAISGEIYRDSSNYGIQSTGASMTKRAGILLRREYRRSRLFEICLFEHDCIIIMCKMKDAEECKVILQEKMEQAAKEFCPSLAIHADAKITNKWNK